MRCTGSITQEDIYAGRPCETRKCPFAIALQRLFPDHRVSVGTTSFGLSTTGVPETEVRYRVPMELQDWTSAYDFRGTTAVDPIDFDFELEVDNEATTSSAQLYVF